MTGIVAGTAGVSLRPGRRRGWPAGLGRRPAAWAAALAVVAGELSLVPTMLPRLPWVQGIFTGIVVVHTYAALVLVGFVARRVAATTARRPAYGPAPAQVHRWAGWRPAARGAVPAMLAIGLVAAVLIGQLTAVELAERSALPSPASSGQLEAAAIGAAVAVGLLGFARVSALAVVGGVRWFRRARVRARVLATVVAVVACGILPADTPRPQPSDPARSALQLAAVQARSPWRSGGDGSLVSWPTIGAKGRQLLAGGPTARDIGVATGRPAVEPVRVYVGRDSAAGSSGRARLAVADLARTGAFGRAAILIVIPTGSGWVNPAAPAALEYLWGGDVATVAVQYADVPSWREYLRGTGDARRTSSDLVAAVAAAVAARPPRHRPRVFVYGESLGALGGLAALASSGTDETDGQLWVGVPADAAAVPLGRVERLVHHDDPVAAWSPWLLLGPTGQWHRRWYPFVSFWQATADLAAAYQVPAGHGHRYSGELVDAWRVLLPSRDAGVAPSDSLDAIRAAVLRLGQAGSGSSNLVPSSVGR